MLNWSCPAIHSDVSLSIYGLLSVGFCNKVQTKTTNSVVYGRKGQISWTQATYIKSSYCLFTLLCHAWCIHQAAIFNSVYLCSASTLKGHTKLHWKWCILQAEQCIWWNINSWMAFKIWQKKKKRLQEKVPEPHVPKRKEWKCNLAVVMTVQWDDKNIHHSLHQPVLFVFRWIKWRGVHLFGPSVQIQSQTLHKYKDFHASAALLF